MASGPGRVRVEPKGYEFDVDDDDSIMTAATRNGYLWPTICGGEAACKACASEVIEGIENLAPMTRLEETELRRTFPSLTRNGNVLRLACQARVRGEVVLFKRGVRPRRADIQ